MKLKSGMTVVEVSIVLAILVLLVAISLPTFFQNQKKSREASCAMNLDALSIACKEFASEEGGFPKTMDQLVPAYLDEVPRCPSGGTYTLGTPEGDPPTCSIPTHHL